MALQSPDANSVSTGQLKPQSTWGDFNNFAFVVQQAIGKMQTATLVQIEACSNSDDVSPVGLVDVIPLVNQLDGQGNPTPHVIIYNVPYFRIQGGTNGVIMDPKKGDIGICVFASRDISNIKSTKKQGNPGSHRQYNFADGMYLGGLLNGTPTQYIQFSPQGIKIHSPTAIVLDAPNIQLNSATVEINGTTSTTITTPTFTINAQMNLSGSLTATGDVTAQGTSLHNHTHGGVTVGSGQTGLPS